MSIMVEMFLKIAGEYGPRWFCGEETFRSRSDGRDCSNKRPNVERKYTLSLQ